MSNYYDAFDQEDEVTLEVPNAVFKQAIVEVGETTTGEPGTDAAVDNTGTETHAVLNFTIPRGAKGETGPAGPKGDQGERGEKGETGSTGATGPAGPQGETGAAGPKGDDGVSPTVTITRNQEDTGFVLTITDAEGAHTATIPDGATGPQGPAGPTGATGPQGPQGETGATGATGPQGPAGPTGPAGQGVPTGGATGAFLVKASSTDYDATWQALNNADATGY